MRTTRCWWIARKRKLNQSEWAGLIGGPFLLRVILVARLRCRSHARSLDFAAPGSECQEGNAGDPQWCAVNRRGGGHGVFGSDGVCGVRIDGGDDG